MSDFLEGIRSNYLATGVGSLPFQESTAAVNFVFDTFGNQIPFWPQLPCRSFYENMYVQFCEKLPGIHIDESQRTISVDTQSKVYLTELEECFNKCEAQDLDYFAIHRPYAEALYLFIKRLTGLKGQGFIKGQIIGPLSLGLSVSAENKNPILYNSELRELLPLFLSMKAAWLIEQMKVNDETRIIIFVDEPYLVSVGTSQCALKRDTIIGMINQIVGVIHGQGAIAGLHCCGNTDWELVLETNIDILNFDAYGYLDKLALYSSAISTFLKRGGMLAMGIVPNNNDLLKENLSNRLMQTLREHPALLSNGALITTSCGCSGLSLQLTQKAHALCVELTEKLEDEF